MTKRAVFIGRWNPFHRGHLSIIQEKIDEGIPLLILVRNTPYDLYSPELRKRMIKATMDNLNIDAKVEIIDDIESINYGRGVGYKINEIEVPDNIQRISATKIRSLIEKGDSSWKSYLPLGADQVLENFLLKKGMVIWFTGLPKSGKKEISNLVADKLERVGIKAEQIDGGILRKNISKELSFSKEDRNRNLERATYIAKLLSKNGAIVLSSFITPYDDERTKLRNEINQYASYVEVFVKSSLEACKARDKEGVYEKAEREEIPNFTGVSDPYHEPTNPDLVLNTDQQSIEECAKYVFDYINNFL